QRRTAHPASYLGACVRERRDVVDVERAERTVDARRKAVLFQELAEGEGGSGESAGDPNALRVQLADHLAERGILAADQRQVGHAQAIEPDHPAMFVRPHLRGQFYRGAPNFRKKSGPALSRAAPITYGTNYKTTRIRRPHQSRVRLNARPPR